MVWSRLGIAGKSKKRDRRPTLEELNALTGLFKGKHRARPRSAPMHLIVGFALFSTRRQEEITRITWDGLDQAHSRVFIADMKHPGDKAGNDVWCDLHHRNLQRIVHPRLQGSRNRRFKVPRPTPQRRDAPV